MRTGVWVWVPGSKQAHLMEPHAALFRCNRRRRLDREFRRPTAKTPKCPDCAAIEAHELAEVLPPTLGTRHSS